MSVNKMPRNNRLARSSALSDITLVTVAAAFLLLHAVGGIRVQPDSTSGPTQPQQEAGNTSFD